MSGILNITGPNNWGSPKIPASVPMSQTGGGGTLGNLAMAFEQPTQGLFKNLAAQRKQKRDIALEGVIADIGQEQTDEANRIKLEIADLERQLQQSEGDKDRQTKIQVEIEKRNTKLAELQFKKDNPVVLF